jgi:hypothetical protein
MLRKILTSTKLNFHSGRDGFKMKNELTDEEKKKECERICGDSGKRGVHRTAPVMCPILEEQWKNPKKPPQY